MRCRVISMFVFKLKLVHCTFYISYINRFIQPIVSKCYRSRKCLTRTNFDILHISVIFSNKRCIILYNNPYLVCKRTFYCTCSFRCNIITRFISAACLKCTHIGLCKRIVKYIFVHIKAVFVIISYSPSYACLLNYKWLVFHCSIIVHCVFVRNIRIVSKLIDKVALTVNGHIEMNIWCLTYYIVQIQCIHISEECL